MIIRLGLVFGAAVTAGAALGAGATLAACMAMRQMRDRRSHDAVVDPPVAPPPAPMAPLDPDPAIGV